MTRDDKRVAALSGFVGIGLILAGIVLCVLWGCAVPATVPAFPEAETRAAASLVASAPASRPVAESRPECIESWAERRIAELSRQFNVKPPEWEIEYGNSPMNWATLGYIRALYRTDVCCIRIYSNTPWGEPYTRGQMKEAFLHEFFHHLERVNGVEPKADHNDEFARWIKVTGIDRDR